MMPKKLSNDLPQGDMKKWVNDALTFIEGPEAISKSKSFKSNGSKNCQINKPIDHKKAAKKAKQKLKKEERKLLDELNELREQFHGTYFKEFDAKNELKDYKSNKKQDKKKVLTVETNVKKLKKTKSKIETNILELIGSLKTINPTFKFSYLPTKEELQVYVQRCRAEAEEKLKPQNLMPSVLPSSAQLLPNGIPLHLAAPTEAITFSGPFGPPTINPNLFAPPGFAPMFPTNPNFFTSPVYSNATTEKDLDSNKDLSERIVTIRRVYLPDNEAQVTVTAKGNSPEQDKLLYTFVNGQLVPANKVSATSLPKSKCNKKGKNQSKSEMQQQQNSNSDTKKCNKKINKKANDSTNQNIDQRIQTSQQMKKTAIFAEENIPTQQSSQSNPSKTSKKKNKKNSQNITESQIESSPLINKIDFISPMTASEGSEMIKKKSKKKKSKKKKAIMESETSIAKDNNVDVISNGQNSFSNNTTEPIQLNFGENDVLTLVKLNGNDNVSAYNNKYHTQQQQQPQQQFYKTNFNEQNHDCSNHPQYKFNNNLEDLYPAMKNLSLNSSSNDLSNSYNKSESPSIMEQLKQGVNVENLKLPPGISLTKVDPATSQALRAKQNSIQKISQSINEVNQQNQPQHQGYAPIYPNIEITPHFMHHDPSGLIMIDTNRSNLYQQHQQHQQFTQINGGGLPRTISSSTYQPTKISNNQQIQSTAKPKKKNKKNKNKQNSLENQNNNNTNSASKIITLKNPMFNNMPPPPKAPPGFVQPTAVDDQPALITKNENGMFTIRNTALQENFLARYPYAGPGGILIPTSAPPGIPTPQYNLGSPIASNCDDSRRNNYTYPHSIPFQESMKDHVCEPNGY